MTKVMISVVVGLATAFAGCSTQTIQTAAGTRSETQLRLPSMVLDIQNLSYDHEMEVTIIGTWETSQISPKERALITKFIFADDLVVRITGYQRGRLIGTVTRTYCGPFHLTDKQAWEVTPDQLSMTPKQRDTSCGDLGRGWWFDSWGLRGRWDGGSIRARSGGRRGSRISIRINGSGNANWRPY